MFVCLVKPSALGGKQLLGVLNAHVEETFWAPSHWAIYNDLSRAEVTPNGGLVRAVRESPPKMALNSVKDL